MPANNKTFQDFCKSGGRITCSQVKKIIEEIEILEKKKLKNILTLIMGLLLASLAGMKVKNLCGDHPPACELIREFPNEKIALN